jgi:hypothetical protein
MAVVMRLDQAEGLLAALLEGGGEHSLGDVISLIVSGECQMFEGDGATIITEIVETPQQGMGVHIWLAAGELEKVIALSREVLDWAREIGCTRATLTGRKGWVRALRGEGWSHEMVVMGRSL